MPRRRQARHAQARHWTHRVAGLPWITLVLLAGLLVAGVELLRSEDFAADAVLSAPSALAADRASVALTARDMVTRVEQEVELTDPDLRRGLSLGVAEDDEPLEVVARATASDPRLAALAADTAAVLVMQDHPEVGYQLVAAAATPTEPERGRATWWVWPGLLALGLALWAEGAHRLWLRDHPDAVAEGAR